MDSRKEGVLLVKEEKTNYSVNTVFKKLLDIDSGDRLKTEEQLVRELIDVLENQGYARADIKNNEDLEANLKYRLEQLNETKFSDKEWSFLLGDIRKGTREEKIEKIQGDGNIVHLRRDNGTDANIKLIDKRN